MELSGRDATRTAIKGVFLNSFKPLLNLIVESAGDSKKLAKLRKTKGGTMFADSEQLELWTKILTAIDLDDLQTWTKDTIEKRAKEHKKLLEKQ